MHKNTLLIFLCALFAINVNAQISEGFEGPVFPPAGWTTFIGTNGLGTEANWIETTDFANTGTHSAYVRYENVADGEFAEDWLVTNQIDLSTLANPELRFFSRQEYADDYSTLYEIKISIASQTNPADFTTIASWDETTIDNNDGNFSQKIIDLSAYATSQVYIAFVMTQDFGDNWILDDVSIAQALTCEAPLNVYSYFLTDLSLDFTWDQPDTGTPVGYDWEIVTSGAGQGNSIVTSGSTVEKNAATGNVLTPSTNYDIYLRSNCGSGGFSTYLGPVSFTTVAVAPPANDVCNNSVLVTHETSIPDADSATPTSGTVANAFNVNVPIVECNLFTAIDASDDVWYSFVATSTDVTVTADTNFDAVLYLYTGSCDALTYVNCSDSTPEPTGGVEQAGASNLTVGNTYYARLLSFGDVQPANPTFTLKVWTTSSLSIDDKVQNSFTYYPNPVKNSLYLKAQNTIQNVSVYNMLGQEVLRTAPNTIEKELSLSNLTVGTYIVKVKINDVTKTIRIIKQ